MVDIASECSTCGAWLALASGEGECHAHPPMPLFGAHYGQAGGGVPQMIYQFPITAADDWCREHSAKLP